MRAIDPDGTHVDHTDESASRLSEAPGYQKNQHYDQHDPENADAAMAIAVAVASEAAAKTAEQENDENNDENGSQDIMYLRCSTY